MTIVVAKKPCNFLITNCNLLTIVNGKKTDPIELRLFDFCFQKKNIWKWWNNVGFMPMTRECLNGEKVRQELGEDGALVEQEKMV